MDSYRTVTTHNAAAIEDPSRMLHQIAQPLATVQGILELTLTEAMSADEKKAWLQQAMEQLLRATSGFDQLRQVVETQKSGDLSRERGTFSMSSSAMPASQVGCEETSSKPSGVLIVSSNQELRRSLVARLEMGQGSLLEAASGAEALQFIDTKQIALILLDPGLPDLKVDDFRSIIETDYPSVTIIPINPRTGQPIVASPSPDSICFEMIRKIERGSMFSPPPIAASSESEDTTPNQEALPDSSGRRRSCNVWSIWSARSLNATRPF